MQRTYLLTEHLTSSYANTVHGQVLIGSPQDPDIHMILLQAFFHSSNTHIREKFTLDGAVSTKLAMRRSIVDPAAGMGCVMHVRMATTMTMMDGERNPNPNCL